eukprot:2966601-Amphidinium_carterae.1
MNCILLIVIITASVQRQVRKRTLNGGMLAIAIDPFAQPGKAQHQCMAPIALPCARGRAARQHLEWRLQEQPHANAGRHFLGKQTAALTSGNTNALGGVDFYASFSSLACETSSRLGT